jgi:catechol 2,3-dioxygenase-like lactoylglutathione lyase family enzyme
VCPPPDVSSPDDAETGPANRGPTTGQDKAMFDHLSIQCADQPASVRFYTRVLAPLGGQPLVHAEDVAGFGTDRPMFWVGTLRYGDGFRESHIAFTAADRAQVTAFFDAAVADGAEVLHAPKIRPEYHENYFGAFVRDPDGNNVEAVCHAPE